MTHITLLNKRTARRRLRPFILGTSLAATVYGIVSLTGSIASGYAIRDGVKSVMTSVQTKDYESARKEIQSLYQDGTFDTNKRDSMLASLEIADKVSDLEGKIKDYDYMGATNLLYGLKDKPGFTEFEGGASFESKLEDIAPENILENAESFLIPNGGRRQEMPVYEAITDNLFGMCKHNSSGKNLLTLAEFLTTGKYGFRNMDLKAAQKRLSNVVRFTKEFNKFELPVDQYSKFIEDLIDYAKPLPERNFNRDGTILNYDRTIILGDAIDLNAFVQIPEGTRKRIKLSLFEAYEGTVRNLVSDLNKFNEAKEKAKLATALFRSAHQHDYRILNTAIYHDFLDGDLRPLTAIEEEKQRMETEHGRNIVTAQEYLKNITSDLIPQSKYAEAYQTVLRGRQALMNGGVKEDEQPILAEFERLGLEITNLMRSK